MCNLTFDVFVDFINIFFVLFWGITITYLGMWSFGQLHIECCYLKQITYTYVHHNMQLWYKSIPLVLWNYKKKKIISCAPSFFRICRVEIRVNLYEVGVLKEKRNGGGRQVVWPCMKVKCSWTFLCVLSSADNNLRDKNIYLYCTLIKIRQEPIDWKYPMNPV